MSAELKQDLQVKIASAFDMQNLLYLAKLYVDELGLTFDRENAEQTLKNYMYNDDTVVLLIKQGNIPAGAALLAYENDFHVEKTGIIMRFYIAPFARKSGAGRKLAEFCTYWFDNQNCHESSAISGANISNKHFENLMRKFGYESKGAVLSRKKP